MHRFPEDSQHRSWHWKFLLCQKKTIVQCLWVQISNTKQLVEKSGMFGSANLSIAQPQTQWHGLKSKSRNVEKPVDSHTRWEKSQGICESESWRAFYVSNTLHTSQPVIVHPYQAGLCWKKPSDVGWNAKRNKLHELWLLFLTIILHNCSDCSWLNLMSFYAPSPLWRCKKVQTHRELSDTSTLSHKRTKHSGHFYPGQRSVICFSQPSTVAKWVCLTFGWVSSPW